LTYDRLTGNYHLVTDELATDELATDELATNLPEPAIEPIELLVTAEM
jgi:hypothetical protein